MRLEADLLLEATDPRVETSPLSSCGHWSEMGEAEHFVQFYEEDTFLVDSVGEFIGSGLGGGRGTIVIATKAHREALEKQLLAQGIDTEAVKARGQFFPLDAAETLSMFMVDGMPDKGLFTEVIGGVVAKISKGRRGLRAFGEMVALLWADGTGDAAIRLEELWNDLAKVHSFSLFCAYPMQGFRDESHGDPFLHICQEHTRVIPAESYAARQRTEDERLRTIALLHQKAAALEGEVAERKRAQEASQKAKNALMKANEELERRVAERTAKLEETVGELEAFSYSISHDMRSPLRAMHAHAKILLEDYRSKLDEEGLASLERIERNAARLDLLVRDVLAYSKVSKGEVSLAPINLQTLIEDVRNNQFETAKARISVEKPLHWVIGHEAYVTQCITNLLENALKFVPPGATPDVRIRTEKDGDKVRVCVCDNGVGIKPEHYGRLFQMFGRVYSEKVFAGTGIGLCIVKKAAARMGGDAGFESEPGRGSTFWFELPSSNA